MPEELGNQDWLAIIGRSLARISMHMAEIDGKTISERATFLESLGMERKEIATMLGTSPASITELLRQKARKAQTNGRNKKNRS